MQTRQKILDAAARVFAARGFNSTSLNDIATAASMKSGSLYFHFESKDVLISEVLREGVVRSLSIVKEAVDALGDRSSARARICTAIAAHVGALSSLASYAAAVLRIVEEVSPELRASFRSDNRQYAAYWNDLVARAQQEGGFVSPAEPRHIRRVLFGAMNATMVNQGQGAAEDEGARLIARLFGLAD